MLARLDGFNAKSGRTRRKRYERRDDETRRCAAGRRFLFVAPFSVAHPCRQEKGIRLLFFSFAPSCLLPALSCPYHPVVSYRLRPVEALRGGRRGVGRYASAGRWRDLASRPSSRPLVSLCGSFDFPVSAYGLVAACAVFVSSFSCVIRWRLVVLFSFSSRPSVSLARLVWRLVLFFATRLLIRFISSICRCLVIPSRLAVRLLFLRPAHRFSVSCLAKLIVSHRLARRLVKQSVFSFRLAACFDGS